MRWNRTVFLICVSFVAKDVEEFFEYLLAICTSSFENCLSSLFAQVNQHTREISAHPCL
jgi:hypothetical protein